MHEHQNNSLLTKLWGGPLWFSLNCIVFGYPLNPTDEDKKHYKTIFEHIGYVLPCNLCQKSYQQFIKTEPTILNDIVFESRNNLIEFIYKLHNRVNDKLNKKYKITLDDFKKKYESFRVVCIPTIPGCVMETSKKMIAYKNAYSKDCSIISYHDAKKFINYASKRNLYINDTINYYNDAYINSKDDIWNYRNSICSKLIEDMRINGLCSLENLDSEYAGLPTINELTLISMLCTNLCDDDLQTIIKKLNNNNIIKKYVFKK